MFRRLLNWLTGSPQPPAVRNAERDEAWYDDKSKFLERELGPEHDLVMHAIIPFAVGGGLDLYYYPQTNGTAIATKELADSNGNGPSNSVFHRYELVMFTRHALDLDNADKPETPFGAAHANINATLNIIANYSSKATLDPHDTCEFPEELDQVGGKCFVFDAYCDAQQGMNGLGLLLVLEVHRSEMEYARQHGGAELIAKLKSHGHYPYSDLDRAAVV